MAGTTARRLAGKTVAAAKKVTKKAVSSRGAAKKVPASKAATKTVAKKAPAATKAAAKKAPAKKAPASKAPTRTVARKAPAKTAAKKTATKAPAKKAPAKKAATRTATRTVAKQTPAKKAATKKTATTTPAKKAATKTAASKPAVTKTTTKTVAKKAPVKKTAVKKTSAAPGRLAVKADEKPWTKKELDEVRGELMADRERLRSELNMAEHELHDLMRDAGDGAGNDQADVGSTTFERDHEMSLANNARDMLAQTERALLRIEAGTYGVCESCGEPIGKMRLMAFPRATLCLSCKQREERR
jgi:RNA polymerase-binding transcription factor